MVPCNVYSRPLQCAYSPAVLGLSLLGEQGTCGVFGPLCRNTHSRHPIRSRRQNVGGNLSIWVHSPTLHTLHIRQHCACARHIYQFVLIRWHRGRQPGVRWERRDQGNYLLIIRGGLPISPCHHSSQTYHFVIPSARSNAPND